MSKFLKRIFAAIELVILFPLYSISQQTFFRILNESSIQNANLKRPIIPEKYITLQLDTTALLKFLSSVPSEKKIPNHITAPTIPIPLPNGSMAFFRIWESSTMAPKLAEQYPNLKTFTGQGISDPTATIKLDWTELGFHAQILSPATTAVYIDNYAQGTLTQYISYFEKDLNTKTTFLEERIFDTFKNENTFAILSDLCLGKQLRTYRLAVACTGEYAKTATGLSSPTLAQALSAIVTTINEVNGIYEKELDIRFNLIGDETKIIFTNPATDPFNGNIDRYTLIDESQRVIDSAIGNANYDMGQTFSTDGGGLSSVGIVCISGEKARTVSGSPAAIGSAQLYVASHEMGHALGAYHSFNSQDFRCWGTGRRGSNAEPGSGSTIMSYPGQCASDNLGNPFGFQFHAVSRNEITNYANGTNCGTLTSTGNTPPVVNAGGNYTIPKSTPFILTGNASDADGDPLTYSWEEIDVNGPFGAWNMPSGNAPLFRSFPPVTTPIRYFPGFSDVINNTITVGEFLPAYNRTMRFCLTARDNRAGGAGVCFDTTAIEVDRTAAPFAISYPTTTGIDWFVNDLKTITWDASTTAATPISASYVKVQLSIDGGNTWPITLLNSTPNDGIEQIIVPNNITSQARVRITAIGNIFYDISNSNFSIKTAPPLLIYTFSGNGSWSNADNWVNKVIPPPTLPRGSKITINPVKDGECLLNLKQTLLEGAKLTVEINSKMKINGELKIQLPYTLITKSINIINGTSVLTGGEIKLQRTLTIEAKGVCWNNSPNPDINDYKTNEGFGTGNYVTSVSGLTANTVYYLRAYAISNGNITYGNIVTFVPNDIPILSTIRPNSITTISAASGGNILSNGDSPITRRGVCWSTIPEPTIADDVTVDGDGIGIFSSEINGLVKNIKYYVRAYATTALGTGYGTEKSFTSLSSDSSISYDSTFTDTRDGEVYKYKTIGTQIWMTENLNYEMPGSLCYNNNINTCDSFGHLYNWHIAQTAAPPGWHVPSDAEWTTLINYLGGATVAGAAMKSTAVWRDDIGATNSSGFTALPAGYRLWYNLKFVNVYFESGWWSSTSINDNSCNLYFIGTQDDVVYISPNSKDFDLSVRCIKDP